MSFVENVLCALLFMGLAGTLYTALASRARQTNCRKKLEMREPQDIDVLTKQLSMKCEGVSSEFIEKEIIQLATLIGVSPTKLRASDRIAEELCLGRVSPWELEKFDLADEFGDTNSLADFILARWSERRTGNAATGN